ncbi:MAG: hypothetical protein ACR2OB_13570 [Solirubrobacteraceae bacterium]
MIALGGGSHAGLARADGDPASDVLVAQALFLPQDAGLPPQQQAQLITLLATARQRGYELRVAVITSPTDLGSVGALWHQPGPYARFLGLELSLAYRGRVLVLMPGGLGLSENGHSIAVRAALAGMRIPAGGSGLGAATLNVIRRLAAASGVALPIPNASATATAGSIDVVPWIVFVVGLALIGAAWTASLKAKPRGPWRPHIGSRPSR